MCCMRKLLHISVLCIKQLNIYNQFVIFGHSKINIFVNYHHRAFLLNVIFYCYLYALKYISYLELNIVIIF